jgi:hypothetical protein
MDSSRLIPPIVTRRHPGVEFLNAGTVDDQKTADTPALLTMSFARLARAASHRRRQ